MSISASNEVVDIINKALEKYNIPLSVKQNAPISGNQLINFINKNDNPITQYLLQTIPPADSSVSYFRCMKTERAIHSLSNKSFRMSNLIANNSNDYAEFSEFFKRMGLFGLLMPEHFCSIRCNSNGIYCDNGFPNKPPRIYTLKDNSFILCFSKDITNTMWEDYCDNHDGVIFEVEITKNSMNAINADIIDFRDVFYDSGYDLEFINEIQNKLKLRFNKELFIEGITRYSYFYKRDKYKDEHETRIIIQNPKCYTINKWQLGQYIDYPFSNTTSYPYCIAIKMLHLGRDVSLHDQTTIQQILYSYGLIANIKLYT